MRTVDPIRSPKEVDAIKKYLKGSNLRDYTLFVVGVNVALRITDLLKLRWGDVLEPNLKNFKDIRIKEGKTKKPRQIKLNKAAQSALMELLESIGYVDMDEYIFKSREGANKQITRQQAQNILKGASSALKIEGSIGTHSLRKTWGFFAWKSGVNPAIIMEALNHSNLSITKRYLGIRQEEINNVYQSLNI